MRRILFAIALAAMLAWSTPSIVAFCGFYVGKADTKLFNKASQVVLVRDGDRTVMTMANDFHGEPRDFAVVIPVPTLITRGQIHVVDKALIDHLDAYSAPRLVESLPTRNQIPAVIGLIYAQAKEAGVPLDTGHYVFSPPKASTLARYDVDFPVKASYPDIRKFINHTLTAVPAAALAKLHVERKTVGDPIVNADIGFVVFVRSE